MGDNTITAQPNLSSDTVDEQMTNIFFTNFDSSVKQEKDLRKTDFIWKTENKSSPII